ncbi:hypothetical protein [Agrobacterium rosae]|uniref:hypothetical protein n=1 Tax=Agrobacterium rosae TaxID=1972867 RepID=UPI0020349DD8|nr:hypothetical protein [Agrobacterium rosae]MCM2433202.1 DEAD/DEAH box helicase family protein [Agrobacterium rosae]
MTKIHYVEAPVGAGKSFALLQHIRENSHETHVIATQTNDVSKELAAQLPNASVINSTDSGKGKSAWKQLKEQIDDEHSVLICNQQVVENQFGRSVDRHLYLDEIPEVHRRLQTQSKITGYAKTLLPKIFYNNDETNTSYMRILPTPELDLIAREGFGFFSGEDRKLIEDVAGAACSPHCLVYMESHPWRLMVAGEDRRLTFHIVKKPSIYNQFQSVTILGANATNSIASLIWSKFDDVRFEPHPIGNNLQYTDLSHKADNVNLFYFARRSASKTLFNDPELGGRDFLFGAIRDTVSVMYGGNVPPHIVCFNKDFPHPERFWNIPGGEAISPDSRGINRFKDRTLAISLAALNDTPDTFQFFQSVFGITSEQLTTARTYERYSQFFGRTAIRDINSNETVDLIAFGEDSALFMQSLIPGAKAPVMIKLHENEAAHSKISKTKRKDMSPDQKREYFKVQKRKQRAKPKAAEAQQHAQ